jgi:hypothetical protein
MLEKIPDICFYWMRDKMLGRLGIFILPNNFGYKDGKVGKVPFLPKISCKMGKMIKSFLCYPKIEGNLLKTLTKCFQGV